MSMVSGCPWFGIETLRHFYVGPFSSHKPRLHTGEEGTPGGVLSTCLW